MTNPCAEYFTYFSSKIELIIFCLLNGIIIFIAIIENVVLIYVIKTKPILHTPTYCLNAALAASDLLITLLGGCWYVTLNAIGRAVICDMKIASVIAHGTFTTTTALILCLITRDRYFCIKNSTNNTPHTTNKKNILRALACFLISLLTSLSVIIELQYHAFNAREAFAVTFFMAFVVMAIYYQRLRKLIKDHPQFQEDRLGREQGRNHPGINLQRHRQSKGFASVNASIIMLVGSFAFAYLPFITLFAMHTINERVFRIWDPKVSHAFVWANSFGYLNTVIDPIIYAFRCDPIGKELRKFIYKAKRRLFRARIQPNQETAENK